MRSHCWASLVAALLATVLANTEKVVFVAPGHITIPDVRPSLDDLGLDVVSPEFPALRTSLAISFPSAKQPFGHEHWFLLQGLTPHLRHELRVCWSATVRDILNIARGGSAASLTNLQQPTTYQLDIYNFTHALETPELIQGLATYAESRKPIRQETAPVSRQESERSIALLRVRAAADFFTPNKTLMREPPEVLVDLLLDPYLGGVFPRSLLPTAAYVTVLAGAAVYISGRVWQRIKPAAAKGRVD